MTMQYETDWLASRPVFYTENPPQAGYTINEVIDFNNLDFHPEGFNNYLDFGYSVLNQTPIKGVKFLGPCSKLTISEDGVLNIEALPDPVETWLGKTVHEDDIFHWLGTAIQDWEQSVSGEIIIPTSGGYDSRLLNFFIHDKQRIRSFTYGVSQNQHDSSEVIFARKLSELLNTRWEWIPLENFHTYLDEWDQMYGASVHAHGMYHLEFYHQIQNRVQGGNPLLSGIFGDVWAGSVEYKSLSSGQQLSQIGYTHGLKADVGQSLLKTDYPLREAFWAENHRQINNEKYQIVHVIRLKMILISYLLTVPMYLGFKPWSPFLSPQIALGMLNLPPHRRKNRLWQQDFFTQNNIGLETMNLKADMGNVLDIQQLRRHPLPQLDVSLLKELVNPDYVKWINATIRHSWSTIMRQRLSGIPKIGGVFRRLGVRDNTLTAYNAYLVLKPIENLLKKRNATVTGAPIPQ